MDTHLVHLIYQYSLSIAAQNDDWQERELGPIHLVKYLYLADLAYASAHGGETYTGIPWRFHKFGPWAECAFFEIDPALTAIKAEKKEIPGKYEDDFMRWRNQDHYLSEKLTKDLDVHVALAVKDAVQKFSSFTEGLLHHVYNTEPMLNAAPGEDLDFHSISPLLEHFEDDSDISKPLSEGQQKRRAKKKELISTELKKRLRKKQEIRKLRSQEDSQQPKPRYDEVFYEGLSWLDSLAGEKLIDEEFTAEISPEIWKSRARYDPDLS